MSNNKQSSVEWLWDKMITEKHTISEWSEIAKQAKVMHKEEIVNAVDAGFDDGIGFIEEMKYKNAEHYYNETFGGKNE